MKSVPKDQLLILGPNWWKFTTEIAKLIKVKRKVRRMLKEDPIPGLKPYITN